MRSASWARRTSAAMLLQAALVLAGCGGASTADSDAVYCLSEAQQVRLAESAVLLGVAGRASRPRSVTVDGAALPVTDWRVARPEDFARACAALVPPRRVSPPGQLLTTLTATGNVIVGALIGFVTARRRDVVLRAEQRAQSLRRALIAYDAAARTYLRSWSGGQAADRPSDHSMHDRRADLAAELRQMRSAYPDAPVAAALEPLDGPLGEAGMRGWRPGDSRAGSVTVALEALADRVYPLIDALEHPWRRRAVLRGRAAGVAPDGTPGSSAPSRPSVGER